MQNGVALVGDMQDKLAEWERALDNVDAIVSDLINSQARLAQQIERAEAVQPVPVSNKDPALRAEQERAIRELEEEREQYRRVNLEIELSVHDLRGKVAARTADVEAAKASAPLGPVKVPSEAVSTRHEPVILVLIDGSSAPFNEDSIGRGWEGGQDAGKRVRREVEKDLREHDIELEDVGEGPITQPAVLCFFWHNRKALVYNLKNSRVIPNDGTWDSFLARFNSVGTNHAVDHGDASVCAAMALLISTVGRSAATKRIYLAGVNLDELYETLPDLRPNKAKATIFHVDIIPKLVLIDHRETEDARETLMTSGWRVAHFLRFFSSHHGLGYDLGWALRPSTPVFGPGD